MTQTILQNITPLCAGVVYGFIFIYTHTWLLCKKRSLIIYLCLSVTKIILGFCFIFFLLHRPWMATILSTIGFLSTFWLTIFYAKVPYE